MLEGQREEIAELDAGPSRILSNKIRLAVVGLALVLALGYLVYAAFPGNTLYYLTVGELLSEANADGNSVRVVGTLVPDSFQRVSGSIQADFSLAGDGQTLQATYDGVVPDLFFNPHSDIILQGSYGGDDVFHADTIIVKCPSKYQALAEEA